jgi:hypothetical protein
MVLGVENDFSQINLLQMTDSVFCEGLNVSSGGFGWFGWVFLGRSAKRKKNIVFPLEGKKPTQTHLNPPFLIFVKKHLGQGVVICASYGW